VQGSTEMTYYPAPVEILERICGGELFTGDEFDRLALSLFHWQASRNPVLRAYAEARGQLMPARWQEIPALPTSAFKRAAIRSFPAEETLTHFRTSGTTEGESGLHYFQSLDWYEAAIVPNFRAHLLPAPDAGPMRMCILTPPPEEAPNSSLVHMMEVVRREFGTTESDYYMRGGELEFERVMSALEGCRAACEPVFLLGTAFAFVFLIERMAEAGCLGAGQECPAYRRLPAGSRIMETGGFKGRTREISREEFYPMLSRAFGVPAASIVNEYGMTELSSQFYDVSLSGGEATAWKSVPPWCRVRAVDPLADRILPDGEQGLIRIWDLANVGSACVLQTEDVGLTRGEQFQVFGRVAAATARGCSLGAEDLLSG